MDAHVFRLLGQELIKLLEGARLEKIHAPAEDILVLTLFNPIFNPGPKQRLVWRFNRQHPAFYLTETPLPNPAEPSSATMRLRKYLGDKRLFNLELDWNQRRIFCNLPIGPGIGPGRAQHHAAATHTGGAAHTGSASKGREPLAFSLGLAEGPVLHTEAQCAAPVVWPPAKTVLLFAKDAPAGQNPGVGPDKAQAWQNYPVLTPFLRKTLACLDGPEALSLMADLEYEAERGQGSLYIYHSARGPLVSAWPLPTALLPPNTPEAAEVIEPQYAANTTGNTAGNTAGEATSPRPVQTLPLLDACKKIFEKPVLEALGLWHGKEDRKAQKSSVNHLERLVKKLAEEEKRLQNLLELRSNAIILQKNLWRFGPDERPPANGQLVLPPEADPWPEADQRMEADRWMEDRAAGQIENPVESRAEAMAEDRAEAPARPTSARQAGLKDARPEIPAGAGLQLNPLLSIRENMLELFHQSARGARGLKILAERKSAALKDLEQAKNGLYLPPLKESRGSKKAAAAAKKTNAPQSKAPQKGAEKLVQRFISSDGFLLLRGRSAQGNQALLKMSMPHDIWFHAADGPSAHLVCRRANAAIEVPRRTLEEAAALTGLKSPQRDAGKAEIMCALVKDVQPIKGQAAGTVRVNRALPGLRVELDPELESRLQEKADG